MAPPNATVRPSLAGLRVVELGQGIAESFAGKMFAAQGADVIKVESPNDGRRTPDGSGRMPSRTASGSLPAIFTT